MRLCLGRVLVLCAAVSSQPGVALAQSESVQGLLQEARLHASQADHRRAADILMRALRIAPNSERVLSDFAENSLAATDPVAAINALEPLSRMHPSVAKYPYLLGVAHLQIGEMDRSVESLRRSLELEPDRVLSLIALGITYNAQKEYGAAREVLQRSLELAPQQTEALIALAEAEEGLGELEAAETHARRALERVESHPGAAFVLGRIAMSRGDFAGARDQFLTAVEISPDLAKAHYQLSLAYARLNDPDNSRKHREFYQEAKAREQEFIVEMRTRAGLGVGGMKQ